MKLLFKLGKWVMKMGFFVPENCPECCGGGGPPPGCDPAVEDCYYAGSPCPGSQYTGGPLFMLARCFTDAGATCLGYNNPCETFSTSSRIYKASELPADAVIVPCGTTGFKCCQCLPQCLDIPETPGIPAECCCSLPATVTVIWSINYVENLPDDNGAFVPFLSVQGGGSMQLVVDINGNGVIVGGPPTAQRTQRNLVNGVPTYVTETVPVDFQGMPFPLCSFLAGVICGGVLNTPGESLCKYISTCEIPFPPNWPHCIQQDCSAIGSDQFGGFTGQCAASAGDCYDWRLVDQWTLVRPDNHSSSSMSWIVHYANLGECGGGCGTSTLLRRPNILPFL